MIILIIELTILYCMGCYPDGGRPDTLVRFLQRVAPHGIKSKKAGSNGLEAWKLRSRPKQSSVIGWCGTRIGVTQTMSFSDASKSLMGLVFLIGSNIGSSTASTEPDGVVEGRDRKEIAEIDVRDFCGTEKSGTDPLHDSERLGIEPNGLEFSGYPSRHGASVSKCQPQ